jgi:SAM-dependent methyltransferase
MKRESFSQLTAPSKTLMSFVSELCQLPLLPILDAGCGLGRNAVALALSGLSVVCVDRDIERLRTLSATAPLYIASIKAPPLVVVGQLHPICIDLNRLYWPFSTNQFSAITCVHFLKIELFDCFWSALVPGGYLFIETFGGHGQNHLDLPKAGQLHDLLSGRFDISFYHENKVGPIGYDAVSVRLLAKKQ